MSYNAIKVPNTIQATIQNNKLFESDTKLLIAVSGGPDSMVLLRCLHDQGYNCVVAHFNHGWRAESKDEAALVEEFCASRNIPLFIGEAKIVKKTEGDARKQRWDFLRTCKSKQGCSVIVTGHNANDRVETMLLNLKRGCGLTGLLAMSYRLGDVVRPLLDCTREEIRSFAYEQHVSWAEDASNDDYRYERNRIRSLVSELFGVDLAVAARSLANMDREHSSSLVTIRKEKTEIKAPEHPLAKWWKPVGGVSYWLQNIDNPQMQLSVCREIVKEVKGDLQDITYDDLVSFCDVVNNGEHPITRKGLIVAKAPNNGPLYFWKEFNQGEWDHISLVYTGNILPTGVDSRGLYAQFMGKRSITVRSRVAGDKINGKKVKTLMKDLGIPTPVRNFIPIVCVDEQATWMPGMVSL